jgi:hypothetical protein
VWHAFRQNTRKPLSWLAFTSSVAGRERSFMSGSAGAQPKNAASGYFFVIHP